VILKKGNDKKMSKNWVRDIEKMHEHFGHKDAVNALEPEMLKELLKLRVVMLREEMQEIEDAENAEEFLDGLIDLCVFAIGTMDLLGADANKAWNAVLRANMKKEVGVKEGRPNPFGLPDLVKPEKWRSPKVDKYTGKLKELLG
jgi:hypothetical protein